MALPRRMDTRLRVDIMSRTTPPRFRRRPLRPMLTTMPGSSFGWA